MEKHTLTSRKRSIDAGFNKMPIPEAKISPFKIKDLHKRAFVVAWPYQKIPTEQLRRG
ncbi:hypothetical protein [Massilia brevitalea]|uniref:hypothetical protein n=1 Tax=Massilia brevitalea TaxID=442526 RepID=UPI00273A08A6|nr:hypothetical protein [Massilia brevitalea]